ncbi:MAG: hypothetical protein HY810_06455 [Candidatus Omnitrophica bacterium]|nr:hypothetical protein [Candidatus Omnitrophota bacterium]
MKNNDSAKFKKLFGIERGKIGQTLIISPFFNAKLFSGYIKKHKYFQGMLYKGVQGVFENREITFVNTGIGASLVVDSVLAQEQNRTKKIIFLGAVGALTGLDVGENVFVEEASIDEKYFNSINSGIENTGLKLFKADAVLIREVKNAAEKLRIKIRGINVTALDSLWQQDKKTQDRLEQNGAQAVDLECAFFYSAAKTKGIQAISLCFVSDHIRHKQYWNEVSPLERCQIKKSIRDLIELSLKLGDGFLLQPEGC